MTDDRERLSEWERTCENAKRYGAPCGRVVGEAAIEAAKDVLQMARVLSRDFCKECGGRGEKTYSSTSLWSGGVGGQAITVGVCDVCWGTGQESVKGPNLRQLRIMAAR